MKTVIDETNPNVLIVAKYFSQPVLKEKVNITTSFEDKYEWVNKDTGLAKQIGKVESIEIFITDEDGLSKAFLTIAQISSIADFYNSVHGKILEPDIVTPEDD